MESAGVNKSPVARYARCSGGQTGGASVEELSAMADARPEILTAPPIWDSVQTGPAPLGALVERNLESLFAGTSDFLQDHSGALLLFGMIACGLFVLAMQLQRMGQAAAGAQGVAGVTLRRP